MTTAPSAPLLRLRAFVSLLRRALWLLSFFLLWQTVGAQVTRPLPIPGRIEAENYDTNGSGISYYDSTPTNSGNVYRTDDVDIEAVSDTGGGYDVGWITSGEWLKYTVTVSATAVYRFAFRVAALSGAGALQVSLDGLPLTGLAPPATGGWQTWQTVTVTNLVLPAGIHTLRLDFKTGGFNLNYFDVTKERNLSGGFLRASGKQIVDGQGSNVVLRGFGLGNWMIQEPYMMSVSGIVTNQQQLQAKIAALVGTNNLTMFYNAWLTNAFRELDVQTLAQNGFNSIRLPMHYNLFTLPADQEPVPGQNTWLTNGFKLVDDLLTWCESNHIYLILDMHACPGGQGYDQSISDYNPPALSLWESSTNRAKLVALWQQLASHYATRPWIGGYDLINEPNWTFENNADIHGCADVTNAPLRQLMLDLTTAIRQVDTNHIIFLMGNCWGGNYSGMFPPWDANLVIGFHKYWDAATTAAFQSWVNLRDQWNLPLWLGESGENSNEWFRDEVRVAEQLNIGWAWWPWKKIGATAGPVLIRVPAGYQAILNYWNGSGSRPTTNDAIAGLLALAQAARFENCDFRKDVVDALLRPDPQGVTLPFKSNTIPGTLFASDYDLGRQSEAYFDTTTNNTYNSGNAYRNDSVDIQTISDGLPTSGCNAGWLDPGDWMKFSVTPRVPGPWRIYARVAGGATGGRFYLDVGGSNVTGLVTVPNSGGYQNWTNILLGNYTNSSFSSFKVVIVTNGFNFSWLTFETVPGNTANLPSGWTDQDIGSPTLPGSAARNPNTGVWVVSGGGADVWNTSDQFHFVSTNLTGNGVIIARVTQLENTAAYPKVGVMLRDTAAANASYAFLFCGTNTVGFENRAGTGATSAGIASTQLARPQWLKLLRTGTNFSGFVSADGLLWNYFGNCSLNLGTTIKAGLAVCANNNAALNAGVLDNVSVLAIPAASALRLGATASADGKIILSWPDWAAGFQLYTATNLLPPVVWTPVTNSSPIQGGTVTVTLPAGAMNRFFRLAVP